MTSISFAAVHRELLEAAGAVQAGIQAGPGRGVPNCGGFHGQVQVSYVIFKY